MNKIPVLLCLLLALIVTGLCFAQSAQPAPPVAPIIPRTEKLHGETRVDNYYWLRERSNPEVMKYIQAENAYTSAIMKPTEGLQETLYQEMVRRIKETDQEAPYREGDYYYYYRTEKGKQYRIYCRKKGTLSAPEEIYFDQNEMAKGSPFYNLWHRVPSPDGTLLAYSVDTSGAENYMLYLKDLSKGIILPDRIENTQDVIWAADGKAIYYVQEDAARRPYRVFCHILGTDPSKDRLVYEEKDTLYTVELAKSRDNKYIFIGSSAFDASEWRFIPAGGVTKEPVIISPRRKGHEYDVDYHEGYFYIRTNSDAKTFRIMRASVASPGEKSWTEVIPCREETTIEGMDFFSHYLVVYEREKGLPVMRVQSLYNGDFHNIGFPDPVYSADPDMNKVYDTNVLRLRYQSLTRPLTIYDYDMKGRQMKLIKQQEVPGGFDSSAYQSERIFATAPDGKSVPISLVYKKGVKLDGTAPLHMTGYGAYGMSSDPIFSTTRLSLLDRGVIYAIAHVRGGSEMGRAWYDDGKLLKKKNTFTDFIACAGHLIKNDYTGSQKLTISGGSAGGLLMGAVVTMRPELFKAVIADVPFVDIINTMLDPTLMYTEQEYLQWGNPNEKIYYDYMKSYDPYMNVKAREYPSMLVKVGLNDPRVNYWEGAKWVARLRALKTDHNIILLKVDMGQGHLGKTGRYDKLREAAFDYAYILTQSGITK